VKYLLIGEELRQVDNITDDDRQDVEDGSLKIVVFDKDKFHLVVVSSDDEDNDGNVQWLEDEWDEIA